LSQIQILVQNPNFGPTNFIPFSAVEEEVPAEEPEEDPLAEIADELQRILEVERKKITKLDSTFSLDI